jgi:O-antigen biosynthesis protein
MEKAKGCRFQSLHSFLSNAELSCTLRQSNHKRIYAVLAGNGTAGCRDVTTGGPVSSPAGPRVAVDGKFFRLRDRKFHIKGVSYGPFAPNASGEFLPSPKQTREDFHHIRELGATVLRIYHVPPRWLLDLALEYDLRLLIDIPWHTHTCFLDSPEMQAAARRIVREAVASCKGHPAVFAYSVANEIPAEIVRWSGAKRVSRFIDDLIYEAKSIDPDCLCTYISFPPTEFLRLESVDFLCFNVYLHERKPFENYLARLQMLANAKPLVLGEFGIDSIREGEPRKCEILGWQIEAIFRAGLAGGVVFSYTDDWQRNRHTVTDWAFGLTTADRRPKPSFDVVRDRFALAPYFPAPRTPKVSVVVATYNGERTLKLCLDSLSRLNYPDYEVILLDDGSTDATPQIAQLYNNIHYLRQPNRGLSAARNAGIAAATGEIIAFTDSDCRADEDWLRYLVGDLLSGDFAGIGGHNFLPPEDSWVAAAVMVSPGGPAHVMLTDRVAEHVPGCNMAFYRWALDEIDGFDPIYTRAGDDVDVCWRLQERGYQIGFSSGGFVWHYRRANAGAYLKQQAGYGEAEGVLARKHPEYFNFFGGGLWRGRIYTAANFGVLLGRAIIYHGTFGSSYFQTLYSPAPAFPLMFCTSIEYHALITLPLFAVSTSFHFLFPVAITSLLLSLAVCVLAAAQAEFPRKKKRLWSRPLVALLFFLQPIARGWARYRWRLTTTSSPKDPVPLELAARRSPPPEVFAFIGPATVERYGFLRTIADELERRGWQAKLDTGWNNYDLEIFGGRWSRLRLITATEDVGPGQRGFRCRLSGKWSFRARLSFLLSLAVEVVAIGLWSNAFPWLWMTLLLQPILGWYISHENNLVQHRIAALLEFAAAREGLRKVDL